jgi:hypothetical protein
MRPTSDPIRRATLVLMAGCALLPSLLALVVIGLGAAAPTTQGLTEATGALSAAAFHGLDRRATDLTPLLAGPEIAFDVLALSSSDAQVPARAPSRAPSPSARLPLRL